MIRRLAGKAAVAGSGAIARTLAEAFEAPGQRWSAQSVAETLRAPGTLALLAPAGCAILRVTLDEAEILTLAVLPNARRQGLGGRLVAACLDGAAGAGARRVHLEVAVSNAAGRALYRAAGFVEAGRRPGYYHGPIHGPNAREDALLMARDLDAIASARRES